MYIIYFEFGERMLMPCTFQKCWSFDDELFGNCFML